MLNSGVRSQESLLRISRCGERWRCVLSVLTNVKGKVARLEHAPLVLLRLPQSDWTLSHIVEEDASTSWQCLDFAQFDTQPFSL